MLGIFPANYIDFIAILSMPGTLLSPLSHLTYVPRGVFSLAAIAVMVSPRDILNFFRSLLFIISPIVIVFNKGRAIRPPQLFFGVSAYHSAGGILIRAARHRQTLQRG